MSDHINELKTKAYDLTEKIKSLDEKIKKDIESTIIFARYLKEKQDDIDKIIEVFDNFPDTTDISGRNMNNLRYADFDRIKSNISERKELSKRLHEVCREIKDHQ